MSENLERIVGGEELRGVELRDYFGDIPIERAMVCWSWGRPHGTGDVYVIPHPDKNKWHERLNLTSSVGACSSDWNNGDSNEMVAKLLTEAMELILFEGVQADMVHEALWVIPEYRARFQSEDSNDNPWPRMRAEIAQCPKRLIDRGRHQPA